MHLQMIPRAPGFCEMTQWGIKTSYECAAGQLSRLIAAYLMLKQCGNPIAWSHKGIHVGL